MKWKKSEILKDNICDVHSKCCDENIKYSVNVLFSINVEGIKMENTATPVHKDFLNNAEIEWQPLSLTLVEYPKGTYHF